MSQKTLLKFLEGMLCKTWKNKIEQQAVIVLLELLEGNAKAEKAVSELTAIDMNNENGMKFLIKKIDKVFESEKIDEAYLVYSRFTNFHKMTNHEMSLPNTY